MTLGVTARMIGCFGVSLPIVQQVPARAADWERAAGGAEIVAIARAADRLGYRYVTCSDHVVVAASHAPTMGATWYEPSSTLGFVAGATERIGLLVHVAVLAYCHPLVTAKTYATLDRLSGGRVLLGVGSGHAKPEFRALGAPYEKRGRFTDEAIAAIRAAWSQEVASYEGELVKFRDVMVSPRPARAGGPPIWVGGNSAAALRRATMLGDGWIPWQLGLEEFAAAVASGSKSRAERRPDIGSGGFEWVAPLAVAREADRGDIRAAIERWSTAGATTFHVGLASRSAPEFIERLQWFREVATAA
jgi:probable F420-dependent oxidoreductase